MEIDKAIDVLKRMRIALATANVDGIRVLEPLNIAIESLEKQAKYEDLIKSIHDTLDLAERHRNECEDMSELAVSNGLALGRIAVTIGHEYLKG